MKKAWQIAYDTLYTAVPVVLSQQEQTWDAMFETEQYENADCIRKWESHVPGSYAPEHVIVGAVQAMDNMGYDVAAAEALIPDGMQALAQQNHAELARLHAKILYLLSKAPKIPTHSHWSYQIYDTYAQYRAKVSFSQYHYDKQSASYLTRTLLGWTAQICGGALGTAIEGYTTENIRLVFGEIYDYPRKPNTFNDDITYELAFLKALEVCGNTLTSCDIAEQWVALIPSGWSAEEIALKNLKLGIFPPESGSCNNPYREWIGAQMRGAVCGMVSPGNPEQAARYAFLDGVVSHHNTGVLGEVFNAVMTSLAYVKTDLHALLEEAISYIPADSEYYSVLADTLQRCKTCSSWEEAWKQCRLRLRTYNWIHAFPNAAAEMIALWFSTSFDEMMHIIAMAGYDVDCNAAQIATVYAIWENKALPEKWTAPIGDLLETYMRNTRTLQISALAEYTVDIGRRIVPK